MLKGDRDPSSFEEESDYSEDDEKNEKQLQAKASTLNPTKSNPAIHHASSNETKNVISKGNFKHHLT